MNYIRVCLAVLFILLLCITGFLFNKVKSLNTELGITKSNLIQYESLVNKTTNDNRVLKLKVEDFSQSNDSLVLELNNYRTKLKIKDKQLNEAYKINTSIIDTAHVNLKDSVNSITSDSIKIISKDSIDFNVEIKPNSLTTVKISRKNDVLTSILEIYNSQDLIVFTDKVYRNKRKNFLSRLIHFDFKKDKIKRYNILNSNPLINITDTRVIDIE